MGVPRQHRWQVATVRPDKFKKDMQKTMKSLLKNVGAHVYAQDDITSLSLNPHFARPMTSGVTAKVISEDHTQDLMQVSANTLNQTVFCILQQLVVF